MGQRYLIHLALSVEIRHADPRSRCIGVRLPGSAKPVNITKLHLHMPKQESLTSSTCSRVYNQDNDSTYVLWIRSGP